MVEYIEREAACALMPDDYYGWRDKQLLKSIPSADVAPVRHGRWERASKSLMVCTACGNCVVDDRISGMFNCPNCGAKMDKEEE